MVTSPSIGHKWTSIGGGVGLSLYFDGRCEESSVVYESDLNGKLKLPFTENLDRPFIKIFSSDFRLRDRLVGVLVVITCK